MRLNGLCLALEMAVNGVKEKDYWHEYAPVLFLGAVREDVMKIPLKEKIWEHWSLSHFYFPRFPGGLIPFLTLGPRIKAKYFLKKAMRFEKQGEKMKAMIELGRALHLIIDMACPTHVHRIPHASDTFEWYVEGNKTHLVQLSVPKINPCKNSDEIITGLAKFTSEFRPDYMGNHIGRIFKRWNITRPITQEEAKKQAEAILPMCAAYIREMLNLYQTQVGTSCKV